jgi:integrase
LRSSTEANLRRARHQVADIRDRIRHWLFDFAVEFPEYKHAPQLTKAPEVEPCEPPTEMPPTPVNASTERTCNDVFDAFLAHCEMRVATHDMAYATWVGYRKILNRSWRPKLGMRDFKSVLYSELVQLAAGQGWKTKKTYNNGISPLRCAFEFGYKDHPHLPNPAGGLDSLRIRKKDLPKIDPFAIDEAEAIIAAVHADWGEAQGNYDEFRFFTGLRPSEQIALLVSDCDLVRGKISVTKARVMARGKDRTKTSEDRLVELCPRALAVLKRQLAVKARLKLAGQIDHEHVFFKEDGSLISISNIPGTGGGERCADLR